MPHPTRRLVLLACALMALALPLTAQPDLVRNGDFQADENKDGVPDGWSKAERVSLPEENGNRWIRIDRSSVSQNVPLPADAWELRLTMRMRATDVVRGKESWQDARLAMSFHNEKGERVGPWPNVFHATGTTDWFDCDRTYRVPTGAVRLTLGASVFGPQGVVEFDDIRIVVTRLRSKMKEDEPLPEGVANVWDMGAAWRVKTPTRERVCLNGLWRFRPVADGEETASVPQANDCWGWFPVPGIWASGSTPETWPQPLVLSPWIEERVALGTMEQAWTKRTFVAPQDWTGRRIWFETTMLQTHAKVFLDGQPVGEIWFPGGRLELTKAVRPGEEQTLALLVTARPLEKESEVFMAPDRIIKSKAVVKNRGITGDVYLLAEPAAEAVEGVQVLTSFRKNRIDFTVELANPGSGMRQLVARIMERGREAKTVTSPLLPAAAALTFGDAWRDPKLWDTDATHNLYTAAVSLLDENGRLLDEFEPVSFGFREFWIEGRDFLLNGTPIRLRALHCGTVGYSADKCSLDACVEGLERMKEYGFNFFIGGNYSFAPGDVGYIDALLEAADRTGVLCSFTLPHIRDVNMKLDQPEQQERYRELARWLVRRVRNHPAVVLYAMNHNATGYYGDQNPLKMDGRYSPETYTDKLTYKGSTTRSKARTQADIAADIAKSLDPTRPVYHHQSGNLGDMHTVKHLPQLGAAPGTGTTGWRTGPGRAPSPCSSWSGACPTSPPGRAIAVPSSSGAADAFQSLWDSEFAAAYVGDGAYEMTERKCKSIAHEEGTVGHGPAVPVVHPERLSERDRGVLPRDQRPVRGHQLARAPHPWRFRHAALGPGPNVAAHGPGRSPQAGLAGTEPPAARHRRRHGQSRQPVHLRQPRRRRLGAHLPRPAPSCAGTCPSAPTSAALPKPSPRRGTTRYPARRCASSSSCSTTAAACASAASPGPAPSEWAPRVSLVKPRREDLRSAQAPPAERRQGGRLRAVGHPSRSTTAPSRTTPSPSTSSPQPQPAPASPCSIPGATPRSSSAPPGCATATWRPMPCPPMPTCW